MEREYTVIANTREDLPALEAEITASSGAGPIPNRSVDIANPRLGSKIQTHFMLTDAEAEALRSDPRVRAVEIPPEQRDDMQIGLAATQKGSYYRGLNDSSDINWGLRRCIAETNVYGSSTTVDGIYEYALDGRGVDIVIQDSGIEPNHPEWQDAQGNTRLQQIDWYAVSGIPGTQSVNHYRDLDGHGTHCAGIAAGKTYGWAKGAHIYSQKLAGLETLSGSDGTGISITDAFDTIRLWHNDKNNPASLNFTGRPTVVNMSWGFRGTSSADPTSGVYRGTPWTFAAETDNELWDNYGIVARFQDGSRRLPAQNTSVDAEVEDMITDGIHICIAAGNDYYKSDVPAGADYNNQVTIGGVTRFYHRPSSPYSSNAFNVGNIDSNIFNDGANDLDRTAGSSKKGPAVNIWAPGQNIMSATSTLKDASYNSVSFTYPLDAAYEIMSIGGTSMASPQVAGVCALHLQVFPNLTPAQLQARMFAETKGVIYTTLNNDTDYRSFTTSILGSPNRMLYSKYGRQAITLSNAVSVLQAVTVT